MKTLKILNLYACLGGNRYKWDEVADVEVTAVELDPELARMYQERFPNDKVIIADAHQYLLEHFKEFDFIWSSPPCPTHSSVRASQRNTKGYKVVYPDMSLYQQIILLQTHYKGFFCIENVRPYYTPLIPAQKRGRHLYWCNFILPNDLCERKEGKGLISTSKNECKKLQEFHNIDLSGYKGDQRKTKIARNLVDYEVGKTILQTALGRYTEKQTIQKTLF